MRRADAADRYVRCRLAPPKRAPETQAAGGQIIRGGHVDELAARRAQPFIHAGEHAPIPFVIDQADAGVPCLKVANDVQAVVGRAVIDDDDFPGGGSCAMIAPTARANTLPWLKFGVTTEKLMLLSVPGDFCSASASPN